MSPGDIRGGRGDIRGGRGDIRVEDPENHILFKHKKRTKNPVLRIIKSYIVKV